ncbi:hypothetical protein ACE6H2_001531 [Prunus campanulata]
MYQKLENYIILINMHYFSEHNLYRRGGRWESLVILYVKGKLKPCCDLVLTDKCSVWCCSSHVMTAYFYNNTLHLLAALKFEATNLLYRTLKFCFLFFSRPFTTPPKSHTTAAAEDPIPERVTPASLQSDRFSESQSNKRKENSKKTEQSHIERRRGRERVSHSRF